MTKPAPQIVPLPLENPALDPFDPANLRLSQAFTETAGVKKLRPPSPYENRARKISSEFIQALSTKRIFRSSN